MRGQRLKVGVIGVGHLGQHHARILASMPEVELVAVVDVDVDRAQVIASQTGARVEKDPFALFSYVDAVTVAVPTVAHDQIVIPFLEKGVPVLVEKPIAASVSQADEMLRAAMSSGTMLAVGHTERFNPAVVAARPLIKDPRFVEVHRLAQFPDRSLDIDVVFDVMIHDLDILLELVNSKPVSIQAVGVEVLSSCVDIANARIGFANGCIANVTASRISRDRVRKLRFFQSDGLISIDCATHEVEAWGVTHGSDGEALINGGSIEVESGEPLKNELDDFVCAVRSGGIPRVDGSAGRSALLLAQHITESMRKEQRDSYEASQLGEERK